MGVKHKRVSLGQQQRKSMRKWVNQVPKPKKPKKQKLHKVAIITRKEQPFPKTGKIKTIRSATGKVLFARVQTVPRLEVGEGAGGMVSSSWISSIEWKGKWALMTLLNGYSYNVYINKKVFEQWYYAHSKGTFFNYMVKGKFKVVRSA